MITRTPRKRQNVFRSAAVEFNASSHDLSSKNFPANSLSEGLTFRPLSWRHSLLRQFQTPCSTIWARLRIWCFQTPSLIDPIYFGMAVAWHMKLAWGDWKIDFSCGRYEMNRCRRTDQKKRQLHTFRYFAVPRFRPILNIKCHRTLLKVKILNWAQRKNDDPELNWRKKWVPSAECWNNKPPKTPQTQVGISSQTSAYTTWEDHWGILILAWRLLSMLIYSIIWPVEKWLLMKWNLLLQDIQYSATQ